MKIKITTLILLLLALSVKAQNINFPDPNFKDTLVNYPCTDFEGDEIFEDVDTDNDGEISLQEAEAVTNLTFVKDDWPQINNLSGIEHFENLEKLSVDTYNYNLNSVDISNNVNLVELTIRKQNINSIDVSQLINLEKLDLSENPISNIDLTNCVNLTHLSIAITMISNLDLTNNSELEYLYAYASLIDNIDLSNNTNLKTLKLNSTLVTQLDVSELSLLESLEINDTLITEIDVTELPLLESLHISRTSITEIDVTENLQLRSLYISNTLISDVDVTENPLLRILSVKETSITEIDVTENLLLMSLSLSDTPIAEINVTENSQLRSLYISNTLIDDIDLSQNQLLEALNISYLDIPNIDLSYHPELRSLSLEGNTVMNSLDVSMLPALHYLSIEQTTNITELNLNNNPIIYLLKLWNSNIERIFIKNGTTGTIYNLQDSSSFGNCPNLQYICINDTDMAFNYFQTILDDYGYENVALNSYCSFDPGGDYSVVEGQTILDSDLNGCSEEDNVYPYLKLIIDDGNETGTLIGSQFGQYYIPLNDGSYTLTPTLENPDYFSVSPTVITADFPTDGSPLTQDLCVTPNGVFDDLEIAMIPINLARPGFDADYKLIYKNKGTTTLSGSLNLQFNDDLMDVVSSNPSVDVTNTNSLQWDYSNLEPFETREINFTMNLNTPTDSNFPLNGEDILDFIATVLPNVSDETPNDNTFELQQMVVNSYDPNDKTCLEGTTITPEMVGDYVHYIIRFENTGTANAINVVIKDVIDTAKFDMATLIPLHASHNFVTRIKNTNEVEFIFENINLPFDDANNDGFVVFKIKTLDTLVLDDTFSNDAEIYFDYNFPIITNDFMTTVSEDVFSPSEFSTSSELKVYPNPTSESLYIESNSDMDAIQISDINGRLLKSITTTDNQRQMTIDVNSLSNGIYFVTISSKGQSTTQKIIKE